MSANISAALADRVASQSEALSLTLTADLRLSLLLPQVVRLQGDEKDAVTLMRGSIKTLEEGGAGHTPSVIRKMGRLAEILVSFYL